VSEHRVEKFFKFRAKPLESRSVPLFVQSFPDFFLGPCSETPDIFEFLVLSLQNLPLGVIIFIRVVVKLNEVGSDREDICTEGCGFALLHFWSSNPRMAEPVAFVRNIQNLVLKVQGVAKVQQINSLTNYHPVAEVHVSVYNLLRVNIGGNFSHLTEPIDSSRFRKPTTILFYDQPPFSFQILPLQKF
jgi:hypothetical protein